jgi:cytochrome bd-type quinol oxidase subunit 2
MVLTLNVAVIAFTVLGAAWLLMRIRLQYLMDYSHSLKARIASQVGGRPALVSGLAILVAQMQMPAGMGNPDHFNNYLVLGYVVMSSIALLYVVTLALRQRNVEKDIALMHQVLDSEKRRA